MVIKGLRLLSAMKSKLPYYVSLFSFCFLLSACGTTLAPRFKGSVFLHDQIPQELCTEELWELGIYRRLSNGDVELLSYCSKEVKNYLAVHGHEIELVEEASE